MRHRAEPHQRVLSATTLIGTRVRNPAGEDLGEVEELMIDLASGRIAYAVLSFGGFLGLGDKLFAVPWQALALDQNDERFVLDVPRESLENAPGFDKDDWPEFTDTAWGARIHEHYGYDPYWDV